MSAAVFGPTLPVVLVVMLLLFVFIIWTFYDIASRPASDFSGPGLTKTAWLLLLILFTVFLTPIGLGMAIYYLASERRKLPTPANRLKREKLNPLFYLLALLLVLVVLFVFVHPYAQGSGSLSPSALVTGRVSGCVVNGRPGVVAPVSISLTAGNGNVERLTIRGTGGSFSMAISPGNYKMVAKVRVSASHTTYHHWAIAFAKPKTSSPQPANPPTILAVSITSPCKSSPS
jgi:hypothetical protein